MLKRNRLGVYLCNVVIGRVELSDTVWNEVNTSRRNRVYVLK